MKNFRTILLLLAAVVAVSCSNSTETKAQSSTLDLKKYINSEGMMKAAGCPVMNILRK